MDAGPSRGSPGAAASPEPIPGWKSKGRSCTAAKSPLHGSPQAPPAATALRGCLFAPKSLFVLFSYQLLIACCYKHRCPSEPRNHLCAPGCTKGRCSPWPSLVVLIPPVLPPRSAQPPSPHCILFSTTPLKSTSKPAPGRRRRRAPAIRMQLVD